LIGIAKVVLFFKILLFWQRFFYENEKKYEFNRKLCKKNFAFVWELKKLPIFAAH
jgi:hypothetical protein